MVKSKSIIFNIRIVIYILTISVVFFGSFWILIKSLNLTIDKNSDSIIAATAIMKEKEKDFLNSIRDKKNLIFVINGKILTIDLNTYYLIEENSNEVIKFESEKVIENMWFLTSKDKYLNAVNGIKNISRNKFLVNKESPSLGEKISLGDLIIDTSNINNIEEVLINPFYDLKIAF